MINFSEEKIRVKIEDTIKWKHIPSMWIGRTNFGKITTLPKHYADSIKPALKILMEYCFLGHIQQFSEFTPGGVGGLCGEPGIETRLASCETNTVLLFWLYDGIFKGHGQYTVKFYMVQ